MDEGKAGFVMRQLFIFYDDRCGLCTWARRWLIRQPAFLELEFIPRSSARSARLFAHLSQDHANDELVVISDEGGVYRGEKAWIMCLYALQEYREWSLRLAQPWLFPLARQTFSLISSGRARLSRWLDLASDAEIVETLRHQPPRLCHVQPTQKPPLNRVSSPTTDGGIAG